MHRYMSRQTRQTGQFNVRLPLSLITAIDRMAAQRWDPGRRGTARVQFVSGLIHRELELEREREAIRARNTQAEA